MRTGKGESGAKKFGVRVWIDIERKKRRKGGGGPEPVKVAPDRPKQGEGGAAAPLEFDEG